MHYRRGVDGKKWQTVWHFNEQCSDYPTRGFAIAEYPPFDGDVCLQCKSLTRDKPHA